MLAFAICVFLLVTAGGSALAQSSAPSVSANASRSAERPPVHKAHPGKQGKQRKHRRSRKHRSSAKGSDPASGVTRSADGWFHYKPTITDTPAEAEQTVQIQGSPTADGCDFADSATMPAVEGQEILREEIAYNPDTCEAVMLERVIGTPDKSASELFHTSVSGPESGVTKYATGHNMQMWVDPVGITITGVSIDLSWPLYGAKGRWGAVPYSYKFGLDGWKTGQLQADFQDVSKEHEQNGERMFGTAYPGTPATGKRATAYQRFENEDFYNVLRAAKAGSVCGNPPAGWTTFTHEVQVVGYRNSRMGTWQHSTKEGPCSGLVHKREKVAWGLKRDDFPREFGDEIGNKIMHHRAFVVSPLEIFADESNAPVPYDLLATELSPTSAKLEGGVNPRGVSTNWWAQCGTTEAYGMWASGQVNIGAGTSSVPVAVTVPNLQPNTTYHCRLVTLNTQGEAAYGQDEEFTTLPVTPPGPIAVTTDAYEARQKSAIISGIVHPEGKATKYYFQYGYWTEYGKTVPLPPGTDVGSGTEGVYEADQITGLEPGQTYHYRIVASNADGTSYGEDRSFKTLEHTPPTVTTETATEVAPTAVTLNGTVNPNGDAARYYFEYGKATASNYEASIPMNGGDAGSGVNPISVSQRLTGLVPGTTYRYRVTAQNSSGGALGAEATFTTVGPGVEPLPPGEVTQSKITMAAKVNGVGLPTTYWFEYGTYAATYGSKTEVKTLPAGNGFQSVSAVLENLPVGWTVHYRIVASSSEGTNAGPDQAVTTAWSQEPAEEVPGTVGAVTLNDVSCAGSGACLAVGSYLNREPYETRVAASVWNGKEWMTVDPPNPADGFYAELSGVSCTSSTSCLAVGTVLTGAGSLKSRELGMRWDGSDWTEIALPPPPAGLDYQLFDIACPAANSCEAVGLSANTYKPNQSPEAKPLALHWDGSTWTQRTTAAPGGEAGSEGLFNSVSCATTTFCKAVGWRAPVGVNADKGLIESLSGSQWVNEATETVGWPQSETNFWLKGVSCPTTTTCVAVGYSGPGPDDSAPKKAFTQNWNGTQWLGSIYRMYEEPNMPTELYDVSCSSATSCRAVGKDGRVAKWSGTQWRMELPKPPADLYLFARRTMALNGVGTTLNGVACPTSTECHAVGSSYINSSSTPSRLIQGWSGVGAVPGAGWTDANSITETNVTFRGAVNPAGVDASYYFEYGPTLSYGSKTGEAKAGSNNLGTNSANWTIGSLSASGLQAGKKYHYRLAVTNGMTTVYSADREFETKSILNEVPTTEPFAGGTSPVSDFGTKWAPLQWTGAAHKGKNNTNGYGPVDTADNGAYFIPPVTEPVRPVAAQAKLAAGPGVGGRVSIWMDMTNPAVEKRGYELRLVETSANVYSVEIKRYFGTNEAVLASATGYSLPTGSRVALIDAGPSVMAWANDGSGWKSVASATDSVFSGGNAALEVQGATTTRLTDFKFGIKIEKMASGDAALKAMPVTDELSRTESPLSLSGAWTALPWATAAVKTGKVETTSGWTPTEWSTITGAYWQKAMTSDTGSGDAILVTTNLSVMTTQPSLWLNMPSPTTAKSGYQLKLVGTGGWPIELKLFKWVNGTPTQLGTYTVSFPGGSEGARFALVDRGGTVSVWYCRKGTGEPFYQAFSAADTTYSYGYAGIEGNGPTGLKGLSLGQLPAF